MVVIALCRFLTVPWVGLQYGCYCSVALPHGAVDWSAVWLLLFCGSSSRRRELVCSMVVIVLWLFLTVPWVGLQYGCYCSVALPHGAVGWSVVWLLLFCGSSSRCRELVCSMVVIVLWLFRTVPWVSLQYGCYCSVALPHGAVSWSAVCD